MRPQDFSRRCLLTFPILISFILNLIRKSLQVELNSLIKFLPIEWISKQTFSAARRKISPLAFVELNNTLIHEFYTDNDFKTWKGYRLIAVDGSILYLPNNEETINKYGVCTNQSVTVPMAKASFAYDVLNGLTLDAILNHYLSSERDMAIQHLSNINSIVSTKDLIIADRGYPAIYLMGIFYLQNKDFLIRCDTNLIYEVKKAVQQGLTDTTITISFNKIKGHLRDKLKKSAINIDFNKKMRVRVVAFPLNTGEIEVLLTSLLDVDLFPHTDFKTLYGLRWEAEENFKFHKMRLEIENFSGHSALAVEQDFHATILTANMHALLTNEAQEELLTELEKKDLNYKYKLNENVSLGLLKNELLEVLLNPRRDLVKFCKRIKEQMKKSMIPIREGRKAKRFWKNTKKKHHMNNRRSL